MNNHRNKIFSGFSLLILLIITSTATLGFWQVQRLAEKLTLIETVATRYDAPPLPLSSLTQAEEQAYKHVQVSGQFIGQPLKLQAQYHRNQHGNHWLQLLQLENGAVILLNLGWMEQAATPPALPAATTAPLLPSLTGHVVPWAKSPAFFLPQNNIAEGHFFWPVKAELASYFQQKSLPTPNHYVHLSRCIMVDEASCNGTTAPIASAHQPSLRNDHLHYAITWFSLAIVAFFCWLVWVFRKR